MARRSLLVEIDAGEIRCDACLRLREGCMFGPFRAMTPGMDVRGNACLAAEVALVELLARAMWHSVAQSEGFPEYRNGQEASWVAEAREWLTNGGGR